MRRWLVIVPGAAAAGLLAAACGGSSSTTSSNPAASSKPAASYGASYPASQPTTAAPAAGGTSVSLHSLPGIDGKALVAANGKALYLFEADKNGMSTCSGACAQAWPPDTVTGTPKAGTGVNQGLLGTIHRPDGTAQLTYNGHPLYFFAGDSGPGSVQGQGSKAFGAGWYVVNASGSKIDTS